MSSGSRDADSCSACFLSGRQGSHGKHFPGMRHLNAKLFGLMFWTMIDAPWEYKDGGAVTIE